MSLGPSRLVATHAFLIKQNRAVIERYYGNHIEWNSKELSSLKNSLRDSLRKQQEGRCFYCRRVIKQERKNTAEDIEHFLDKSKEKYRRWAFSPVNLSIACHPCNFEKSTKDMGDNKISIAKKLTTNAGEYTWLHPYFDSYFDNIEVEDGWLYKIKANAPHPSRANKLITECKLDSIKTTEKAGLDLSNRKSRIIILAMHYFGKNPNRSQRLLAHLQELENDGWKYL